MEPEQRKETEQRFLEFLISKGYPREVIVAEPSLGSGLRPDFAILDTKRDMRLAYIEVSERLTIQGQQSIIRRLREYHKAAEKSGARAYLATPDANNTGFDFYYIDENNRHRLMDVSMLPSLNLLNSDVIAARVEKVGDDKEKTSDRFLHICWVSSVVLLLLLVADFICEQYKVQVFTTSRLSILGVAIGLLILPYAQKLKLLGLEYERVSRQKEEKKG